MKVKDLIKIRRDYMEDAHIPHVSVLNNNDDNLIIPEGQYTKWLEVEIYKYKQKYKEACDAIKLLSESFT